MRNNEEGGGHLVATTRGGWETMLAVMTKGGDGKEEDGSEFGICWCKEGY